MKCVHQIIVQNTFLEPHVMRRTSVEVLGWVGTSAKVLGIIYGAEKVVFSICPFLKADKRKCLLLEINFTQMFQ